MKLPEIKKLVENYNTSQLGAAEAAIINGEVLSIEVGGDDAGEQLTHVLAAMWINEHMLNNGTDFRTAQREYVKVVRDVMM
jgi:hypothetical protein